MDEIEFKQAFVRLTRLINTPQKTSIDMDNALKIITDMLMSLNERVCELAGDDPDDESEG